MPLLCCVCTSGRRLRREARFRRLAPSSSTSPDSEQQIYNPNPSSRLAAGLCSVYDIVCLPRRRYDHISNVTAFRSGDWKLSWGKNIAKACEFGYIPDLDYAKARCQVLLPPTGEAAEAAVAISPAGRLLPWAHPESSSPSAADLQSGFKPKPPCPTDAGTGTPICQTKDDPCLFNIAVSSQAHITLLIHYASLHIISHLPAYRLGWVEGVAGCSQRDPTVACDLFGMLVKTER